MRYLRMLSNSVLGGVLGAAYLTILFLQLNPNLPLEPATVAPLFVTLALSYGVHLSVMFYMLIVLRQLVASELLSPGWISFRVLSWLATAVAGAVALEMWLNLRGFGGMLEADTARRMATGAIGLTVCAVVLLLIALVHYSFGRRGSRVSATLFALAVVASLSLPVAARGPGVRRPLGARRLDVAAEPATTAGSPRVVMLLLDGGSLDLVSTAAAEGRLPNFAKLLDAGAVMHLATVKPTQPATVWTAVATGKLPPKNGVRSSARYEVRAAGSEALELLPQFCFSHGLVYFGFITEQPHTSAAVRATPVWSILSRHGIPVGVVGWPLTHPAVPVRGFLVTDEFHRLGAASLEADEPDALYPPDLLPVAREAAEQPAADESAGRVRAWMASGQVPPDVFDGQPYSSDRLYAKVAAELRLVTNPRFVALRYRGLDAVGHDFLRYAMPRTFGDVSEEERLRYGQVIHAYYSVVDGAVGQAMQWLEPEDLLLVVSGFGMQPLPVGKRLLERALGNPDHSGTHEGAPDGFLLAYGTAVAPGRRDRASVVDITPTILYFLGLPVGRDMDGYARTDIFRPSFTEDRPITFIPTYDR